MSKLRAGVYRGLQSVGLQVSRSRSAFADAKRLLQGHKVKHVIDGGAFDGGTALRLAQLFPEATIHAFEPQEESFQILTARTAGNPRVRAYPVALSQSPGSAPYYVTAKGFTSSLHQPLDDAVTSGRTVQKVSLDSWAVEQSVPQVEFLKLDLQGHELSALEGARNLLKKGTLGLLVEVNFRARYEGCALFHEVAALLYSLEFEIYRLYSVIDDAQRRWQLADALFLHKRILNE